MNDGGPAFPRPLGSISAEEWNSDQEGMSLRDYFAAKAMDGLLASGHTRFLIASGCPDYASAIRAICKEAYQYADDMLAARAIKPENRG